MGRAPLRVSAALALTGAVLALAAPAHARSRPQPPPAVQSSTGAELNNMYASVEGVPATLAAGDTMDLTIDMHWESLLPIDITGLGLSMSSDVPDTPPTQGISVLWEDPKTSAWRGSDQIDTGNGFWGITEPTRAVVIPGGGTLAVHVQITMDGTAAPGTEHLSAGQFDFLETGSGALLRSTTASHDVEASFQFGTPDPGDGGEPTPTASPAPAGDPTTAAPGSPTPTPTVSVTASPLTVPAAAVGTPGGHKPSGHATGPSPVPPSRTAPPDTITEANIVLHGAKGASAFAAITVLLAFLAGSALVIVRSRRSETAAATAAAPTDAED